MQAEVLALFEGKDLNALSINDNIRFRFTMRKANAARAAAFQGGAAMDEFSSLAMETYGEALEIYPANPDALTIAYATMNEALNTRDPQDLAVELQARPEWQENFRAVYENLAIDQKPAFNPTDGLIGEIESWRQNVITIP